MGRSLLESFCLFVFDSLSGKGDGTPELAQIAQIAMFDGVVSGLMTNPFAPSPWRGHKTSTRVHSVGDERNSGVGELRDRTPRARAPHRKRGRRRDDFVSLHGPHHRREKSLRDQPGGRTCAMS